MRIHHKPGDTMQVDWAGDTLPIYDSVTGEITPAYAAWFIGMKNTKQAKQEILKLFSMEPDDEHIWSEQDIYEQARKIIIRWNNSKAHLD